MWVFLFAWTIAIKMTQQKKQSTKYLSMHYNLHITNNKTYSMLLTEKKNSFGVTLTDTIETNTSTLITS